MTLPRLAKQDLTEREKERYDYLTAQGRSRGEVLREIAWVREKIKARQGVR